MSHPSTLTLSPVYQDKTSNFKLRSQYRVGTHTGSSKSLCIQKKNMFDKKEIKRQKRNARRHQRRKLVRYSNAQLGERSPFWEERFKYRRKQRKHQPTPQSKENSFIPPQVKKKTKPDSRPKPNCSIPQIS